MRRSQLPLLTDDHELIDLLASCNDDELKPLAGYILGLNDIDQLKNENVGRFASELDTTEAFKNNKDFPSNYYREIAAEIQTFGGNTIMNIARSGKGVYYREVVMDAAKKLKIQFSEHSLTEDIEMMILLKVLSDAYEKMSDDERFELLKEIGHDLKDLPPKALPIMALQVLIRASGFRAYKLAAIVAQSVAKALLGRGFFVLGPAMGNILSTLAGPIGWVISSLWVVSDMSSPATRVTIPCVIHCAYLRLKKAEEKEKENSA